MKELQERLAKMQQQLKAPKGQFNSFGKYKYRSCEDILEAVKPLLKDCTLTVSDNVVMLGDRFYINATAMLSLGDRNVSVDGWARESENKKGMDSAQVTGAASSYARKYALNGLFCIDDTKDSDFTNKGDTNKTKKETSKFKPKEKITKEQIDKITILATEKDISVEDFKDRLKKKFKVDKIEQLYLDEAEQLITMLS